MVEARGPCSLIKPVKAVASPQREVHVIGDSSSRTDLYGMREHSLGSIPHHVVQSGVDDISPNQAFLPKGISVLYILADSWLEFRRRWPLLVKFAMSMNADFTHSIR